MKRLILAGCLSIALLTGFASAAGAANLEPTTYNFGVQKIGTTSAPKAFTLTVPCANPDDMEEFCLPPDNITPDVTITGDYAQTNNCPSVIVHPTAAPVTCTINVTFKPQSGGTRNGFLTTSQGDATLFGQAIGSGTGTTTKKKCKKAKKGSASAAKKKCKKKKK